jgi:hypothetical protein
MATAVLVGCEVKPKDTEIKVDTEPTPPEATKVEVDANRPEGTKVEVDTNK